MPDYKVDERLWEGCRQVEVDTGLLATRTAFVQSVEGCRRPGEQEVIVGLREMADTDADILTTPEFQSQIRSELGSEGFVVPGCS